MTLAASVTFPIDSPAPAVDILFFGRVADRLGRRRRVAIPAEGCTLADLKRRLAALAEGGGEALDEAGVRAAIDQRLAPNDDSLARPGQEVAFFSAFSGG